MNMVNLIWNNKFSKNFLIDAFLALSIIYNVSKSNKNLKLA
jgi:hypothetical protein